MSEAVDALLTRIKADGAGACVSVDEWNMLWQWFTKGRVRRPRVDAPWYIDSIPIKIERTEEHGVQEEASTEAQAEAKGQV